MTYKEIKKHKWRRNDIIDDIHRECACIDPAGEFEVVGIISHTWVAIAKPYNKPILEDIKRFGKGKKYEIA